VFHSTEGELSARQAQDQYGSAQVSSQRGESRYAADITAVKNAICAERAASLAVGTCSNCGKWAMVTQAPARPSNPANKGAFIVQFNYRFTDKSDLIDNRHHLL
jgi:hypothetical protein